MEEINQKDPTVLKKELLDEPEEIDETSVPESDNILPATQGSEQLVLEDVNGNKIALTSHSLDVITLGEVAILMKEKYFNGNNKKKKRRYIG